MGKRTNDTNESIAVEIVEDFLPPPSEIARRARKVKVTLEVTQPTVDVFRKKAGGTVQSRRMMEQLLDFYATKQR